MIRRCAALAGAAALCAVTASPVSAQVVETRPFPGLFGSGDPAKSVTQVDFISFLAGGYESTTASVDGLPRGSVDDQNSYGNLVFRGRVAHQGRRTNFGANGGATTLYYTGLTGLSPVSLSGSAHFSGQVGRRGTFSVSQTMFYSPYFVFGSVTPPQFVEQPEMPVAVEPGVDPRVDLRTARASTKGYTTYASAGRQVGQNGTFFASYWLNYVDSAPGLYDLLSQIPRAGYRHRVGRFGSLVASYGLELYEYRNSPFARATGHNVSVGFGYDRPLSAWRRTTVGFNLSTAFIRERLVTKPTLNAHLNANAHLHRRFGRTWVTGLTYLRGQEVLEGFVAPFFTFYDTGLLSFSGRLGRDIGLSGHASYSHSKYSIGELDNVFDTMAASVRLQVPVMWALAAYVEGYYAEHDFQQRLGLVQGIPTEFERLGIRTGLTVSVPVFR